MAGLPTNGGRAKRAKPRAAQRQAAQRHDVPDCGVGPLGRLRWAIGELRAYLVERRRP